jgi:hypothetical protein
MINIRQTIISDFLNDILYLNKKIDSKVFFKTDNKLCELIEKSAKSQLLPMYKNRNRYIISSIIIFLWGLIVVSDHILNKLHEYEWFTPIASCILVFISICMYTAIVSRHRMIKTLKSIDRLIDLHDEAINIIIDNDESDIRMLEAKYIEIWKWLDTHTQFVILCDWKSTNLINIRVL